MRREYKSIQEVTLEEMGTIKEILNDRNKLLKIIAFPDNGDLLYTFFQKVNECINNNKLLPDDLNNIRSGWFGNTVINLEYYLTMFERELLPGEKYTKLSCFSIIDDVSSQLATFSNYIFINALAGLSDDEELTKATFVFENLDEEVKLEIIKKLVDVNATDRAKHFLTILIDELATERRSNDQEMTKIYRKKLIKK